jgi:hypothetical protein
MMPLPETKRTISRDAARLLPAALVLWAACSAARGETIVPITGIGTQIDAIDTQVEQVAYTGPVAKIVDSLPVLEIRGTVSGIGWGGTGIVPRASAHYRYDIPFVARWQSSGVLPRLVFFQHGGGVSLMVALQREKLVGAANHHRVAELNGDLLAGKPALLDSATYVSINRRGLRGDGTFAATYLAPVAPLSASEVASVEAALASAPGTPGFVQPGLVAGAPVPLVPTNDTATARDIARALEHVLADIQGQPFQTRIGAGLSSGARLLAAMNFGRSVQGTQSVRTGGNHVVPYDAASPRIFDGFLLCGFSYIAGADHVDPALPISAPAMFFHGQADERYQQHVTLAHELLQKGVDLNGQVWLYDIKNLPHVTRDVTQETGDGPDSDPLGCMLSAGLRNLRGHLEGGPPPPDSRLAGRIVSGMLCFDQAGGTLAQVTPIPNHPALDRVVFDAMVAPRPIGSAETARWLAVTAELPHVPEAIAPPTVACRLGGYKLMFFGSELMPDSPAQLSARYGSFECYREAVRRTVAGLEAQGLYDARVESADHTAERARALFPPTHTQSIPPPFARRFRRR